MGPFFLPDGADDLREDVVAALSAGSVVVPQHWRLEVANLAMTAVRRGRLSDDLLPSVMTRLADLMKRLADFIVETDPQTERNAWSATLDLSRRHSLTLYDAAYLELALRTGARIATSDKRLRRAAQDCDVLL
jgi:predicted nucleic acid-binding protein